jgi:hypothetical protein
MLARPQPGYATSDIELNTLSEAAMRRTILLGILALGGCSSSPTNPVIADKSVYLTTTMSFTYAELIAAALVVGATWYVVDPLAPNWEVKETKLADNRFRLEMRKKNFTTGADGEAIDLLHRHASKLAEVQGYKRYLIMAWNEGIQSDVPFAHRWARGTVELREYVPPEPPRD